MLQLLKVDHRPNEFRKLITKQRYPPNKKNTKSIINLLNAIQ